MTGHDVAASSWSICDTFSSVSVQPGTLLSQNIRVERELGRGAMGVVWVADQLALGTKVAVKVLAPAAFGQADARARFTHEAQRAAAIDSPHVVKVFDFGFTPVGDPFIVMELLRGVDLERRLASNGPLDLRSTAAIITQLCRALDRAHALGLVHRDIKPANVFLLDGHGEPFVKLLDFGVSKAQSGGHDLTATGAAIGTPYFMSPEQFMGAPDIDHRSDLWSVAVLAYACLTRMMPFVGPSVPAISVAAHAGQFQPPSRLSPHLPPAIDAWFARAFRVDRRERFQSARELADSFEQASRARADVDPYAATRTADQQAAGASYAPPHANTTAPSVLGPTHAPTARGARSITPWVVGGLAITLLASGVGAVSYALGGRTAAERTSEEHEEESPRKKKKKLSEPEDSAQPAAPGPPPAPDPTPERAPEPRPQEEKPKPSAPPPSSPTASAKPALPATHWRKRGIRCALTASKTCIPCCPIKGDILGPAPDCECLFDGDAWDKGKR